MNNEFKKLINLVLVLILVLPFIQVKDGSAQTMPAFVRLVRTMENDETGLFQPAGLVFSSATNMLLAMEMKASGQPPFTGSELTKLGLFGKRHGSIQIGELIQDPINMTFNNKTGDLLALQISSNQLLAIQAGADGTLIPGSIVRYDVGQLGLQSAQGMAVDGKSGNLFILDAVKLRIVRLEAGRDGDYRHAKISVINLRASGLISPHGLAIDPTSGNLHVMDLQGQKLYELTQGGLFVHVRDLGRLGLKSPQGMVFAPSRDQTDDPSQMNLFIADNGPVTATKRTSSSTQSSGQIMELSLLQPASLPPGTTLLPATLIRTFDTSNKAWNPSSPDPSGVDYWPPTGGLIIVDSEVDEMPNYFTGDNIYLSSRSGILTGTCSTTTLSRSGWSNEPTGVAVNPNNNNIFITDDDKFKVFEVDLGPDGKYCTSDDTVTSVSTTVDTEDVAYGNNTLFIAGGADAEIVEFDLGPDGKLGGGDDGQITHFDTAVLGFNDLEGIDYNPDNDTLFIVSTAASDRYLGEITTSGTLLRAYDLSFMGTAGNIRSDVAWVPSSQNPLIKSIYIVSRGIDNNTDPNENDGKTWEISIGETGPTATSTNTLFPTNTPTGGPSSTPTNTPTSTATNTATAIFTPTPLPSSNPFYASFASGGSVGGVTFSDEDILKFDGTTWSLFFDGSDVGVGSLDTFAFSILSSNTLLMSFDKAITLGGLAITPQDVLRFDATSLGSVTAGTFSMYLDGSDVGLDTSSESIDSISLLPDGKILLSVTSSASVPGISALDEDILAFTPTTLGDVTTGTWSLYFDGSDVGLADSSNEDVDALDIDAAGAIYLSTLGDFSVPGVSGADEDVFVCQPTSLGNVTTCNYWSNLYFDGSTWGQSANDMDAFNLPLTGSIQTPTASNTPPPTNTVTQTPTPTITFTATSTNTPTATPAPTFTFTVTSTPTVGLPPTATNTPTVTATFTPSNTPTQTFTPTVTFSPTATFTATPTSPLPDLIFADGFESGDFSAWTSSNSDTGALSVNSQAALVGNYGLQVVVNNTSSNYLIHDLPVAESRYRARFYFDPNSISMVDSNAHYLLIGYDGIPSSSGVAVVSVDFRYSTGNYQLRLRQNTDNLSTVSTSWITISDTPHYVELDWWAASADGLNNGGLTFWIDGVQRGSLSGLDNDTRRIQRVRFGAAAGVDAGTIGTYYLDAFESHRQTYIGQ